MLFFQVERDKCHQAAIRNTLAACRIGLAASPI